MQYVYLNVNGTKIIITRDSTAFLLINVIPSSFRSAAQHWLGTLHEFTHVRYFTRCLNYPLFPEEFGRSTRLKVVLSCHQDFFLNKNGRGNLERCLVEFNTSECCTISQSKIVIYFENSLMTAMCYKKCNNYSCSWKKCYYTFQFLRYLKLIGYYDKWLYIYIIRRTNYMKKIGEFASAI